jgi:hypothetical protein
MKTINFILKERWLLKSQTRLEGNNSNQTQDPLKLSSKDPAVVISHCPNGDDAGQENYANEVAIGHRTVLEPAHRAIGETVPRRKVV